MDPLTTFSHVHCLALCTGLVTLITVVSLLRLALVAGSLIWHRQISQTLISILTGILGVGGGLLLLHVLSWWVVGVVMVPTYILPGVVGLYWGFAWGCDQAKQA